MQFKAAPAARLHFRYRAPVCPAAALRMAALGRRVEAVPVSQSKKSKSGWVEDASSEASSDIDSAPGRMAYAKRTRRRTCGVAWT